MADLEPPLPDLPSVASELAEVACLEAFWASHVQGELKLQEIIGNLLLDTLGLGNQQVYAFLYGEHPSFQRFCHWIAETVGAPDPALLSRYHAWLTGDQPSAVAQAQLAKIASMAPVLDEADLAHWDEQGFVVLSQAITLAQAAAVRDLIWEEKGASPDDPASWYGSRTDGIMISRFQHPALNAARHSPRIHKAFAQLWGEENLWVRIDRIGFNPPELPDYRFAGSDLHWDVSLARPIPFGTQAVLYLHDTAADQGAFRCVPGFHNRIDTWLDGLEVDPRSMDLSPEQIFVPGKTGDLVIWRQDLPHGASPNRSTAPRLAQYLNFYSPDMTIRSQWR